MTVGKTDFFLFHNEPPVSNDDCVHDRMDVFWVSEFGYGLSFESDSNCTLLWQMFLTKADLGDDDDAPQKPVKPALAPLATPVKVKRRPIRSRSGLLVA